MKSVNIIQSSQLFSAKVSPAQKVENLNQITPEVLHQAEVAKADSPFNIADVVNHHLADAPLWQWEIWGIDMSITKRVVMMWIGSCILMGIFLPLARKITQNPFKRPSRLQGFFEVFINFIRNDVAADAMGKEKNGYQGFLLTLFFFVLAGNLLGLIPPLGELVYTFGSLFGFLSQGNTHGSSFDLPLAIKLWPAITYTGDIGVTAVLATFSFAVILTAGFVHQGAAFIKNIIPNGVPKPLWLIMWPIEIAGLLTKPFALAIRLLANMTAGHMIILVLMGFIFQFQTYGVAAISIPMVVAINLLEIFVAFLQAYIFVFLTALFIAQVQHRH